jgi:hypothetical protein
MDQQQLEQIVKVAVARFGFSASVQSNLIVVKDGKGRVAGSIDTAGVLERKYNGNQALMGALVRDAIKAAIKAA